MRKVKEWEGRHERKLEGCTIWGAVIGGAISVIGGALMKDDSAPSPGSSQTQSANYYDTMANIAKGQYDISKEQWQLYKDEVLPMVRTAATKINPAGSEQQAIAEAVGDTRSQFAQAGQRATRALELSGRNPSDPVHAALDRNMAGMESSAVARAVTHARDQNREQEWQRRLQAVALYNDPAGAASAGAINSARALGGAAQGFQNNALIGLRQQALNRESAGQLGYTAGKIYQGWNAINPGGGSNPMDMESYPPSGSDVPGYGMPFDTGVYGGGVKDGGAITRSGVRRAIGYAGGGEIEGPGTGTSDSIKAIKEPGTYILSADTVRAVGTQKLRTLMEKAGVRPGEGEGSDQRGVQVALSNGEWAMPPPVTKFHGEEFFHKLQQKYHHPVSSGANDDETVTAANGGVIRRRAMPRMVEDAILSHIPSRSIAARG